MESPLPPLEQRSLSRTKTTEGIASERWNVEKKRREFNDKIEVLYNQQIEKCMNIDKRTNERASKLYNEIFYKIKRANPPIPQVHGQIILKKCKHIINFGSNAHFPEDKELKVWNENAKVTQLGKISSELTVLLEKLINVMKKREESISKAQKDLIKTTEKINIQKDGTLQYLIKTNKSVIDQFFTPWYLTNHGKLRELEVLLSAPTFSQRFPNGVNEKDSDFGLTPLHYACKLKNLPIVRFLIEKGADVTARAPDGRTPLHYAAAYSSREILLELLSNGADFHAVDNYHCTPTDLANQNRNKHTIPTMCNWDFLVTREESSNEFGIELEDPVLLEGGHKDLKFDSTIPVEYFPTNPVLLSKFSPTLRLLTKRLDNLNKYLKPPSNNNENTNNNGNQQQEVPPIRKTDLLLDTLIDDSVPLSEREKQLNEFMIEIRLCSKHYRLCVEEGFFTEGQRTLRRRWVAAKDWLQLAQEVIEVGDEQELQGDFGSISSPLTVEVRFNSAEQLVEEAANSKELVEDRFKAEEQIGLGDSHLSVVSSPQNEKQTENENKNEVDTENENKNEVDTENENKNEEEEDSVPNDRPVDLEELKRKFMRGLISTAPPVDLDSVGTEEVGSIGVDVKKISKKIFWEGTSTDMTSSINAITAAEVVEKWENFNNSGLLKVHEGSRVFDGDESIATHGSRAPLTDKIASKVFSEAEQKAYKDYNNVTGRKMKLVSNKDTASDILSIVSPMDKTYNSFNSQLAESSSFTKNSFYINTSRTSQKDKKSIKNVNYTLQLGLELFEVLLKTKKQEGEALMVLQECLSTIIPTSTSRFFLEEEQLEVGSQLKSARVKLLIRKCGLLLFIYDHLFRLDKNSETGREKDMKNSLQQLEPTLVNSSLSFIQLQKPKNLDIGENNYYSNSIAINSGFLTMNPTGETQLPSIHQSITLGEVGLTHSKEVEKITKSEEPINRIEQIYESSQFLIRNEPSLQSEAQSISEGFLQGFTQENSAISQGFYSSYMEDKKENLGFPSELQKALEECFMSAQEAIDLINELYQGLVLEPSSVSLCWFYISCTHERNQEVLGKQRIFLLEGRSELQGERIQLLKRQQEMKINQRDERKKREILDLPPKPLAENEQNEMNSIKERFLENEKLLDIKKKEIYEVFNEESDQANKCLLAAQQAEICAVRLFETETENAIQQMLNHMRLLVKYQPSGDQKLKEVKEKIARKSSEIHQIIRQFSLTDVKKAEKYTKQCIEFLAISTLATDEKKIRFP